MKNIFYSTLVLLILVACSTEDTEDQITIIETTPEVSEDQSSESASDEGENNNSQEQDNNDGDSSNTTVSFSVNIQPIISSNCTSCHQDPPRNGAPFPLLGFEQVSNVADLVLTQVSAGLMPPSGKLPNEEIELIQQWVDDGTPE